MPTDYKYTDFDIDFTKNSFINDVSMRHDRYAVRQSIMNIVLTRKGEKPFNRTFGVGIHDYLFESLSTTDLQKLEMDISEQVTAREPRAEVSRVEITDNENQLTINISYSVRSGVEAQPLLESLKIGLAKVR